MPGWLGVALTSAFAFVAVHRTVWRDVPGALMAAGMAVMALGMAGIGPLFVSGPWWALAFVLIAVWPVLRPVVRLAVAKLAPLGPDRAGPVCGGPLSHLLGGVAMVYMCAMPISGPMSGMTGMSDGSHGVALTAHSSHLSAMSVMADMTPTSTPLALVGWVLACYFLLGTVSALTRRGTDGAVAAPRLSLLGEAAMGLGTVIMLVAMT